MESNLDFSADVQLDYGHQLQDVYAALDGVPFTETGSTICGRRHLSAAHRIENVRAELQACTAKYEEAMKEIANLKAHIQYLERTVSTTSC